MGNGRKAREMRRIVGTSHCDCERNDSGSILIIVLMVALIILSLAAVAMEYTLTNLSDSGSYVNTVQSRLAAESGVGLALSQISHAQDPSGLPCTPTSPYTVPGTTAKYVITIAYSSSVTNGQPSGTDLTANCPFSVSSITLPAVAVITAVGTAANGAPLKLVEDAGISFAQVTTTNPVFTDAIYSASTINLSNHQTLAASTSGQPANIVAEQGVNCSNNTTINGSVYSYSPLPVSISYPCSVTGGVYAVSKISLSGQTMSGSVESFGSGGISVSSSTINGSLFATQGGISASGSAIGGYVSASGAVTGIAGNNASNKYYCGSNTTPTCSNLSSQTMPPDPGFPLLQDASGDTTTSALYWATTEFKNKVVQVPSGQSPQTASCASYFGASGDSGTQFYADITTATVPTVVVAPTCDAQVAKTTYTLTNDVAIVAHSFTTSQQTNFTGAPGQHNLSIIVPTASANCPSGGCISLAQHTTFDPSVALLFYTTGTFNSGNLDNVSGQVIAQDVVTGGNQFNLTFSNAASATLTGTTTTKNDGSASFAEIRRYVSR
jgi:hypothetical protein